MDTNNSGVTVLLADNHTNYRESLKQTLELEDDIDVVGEADNWRDLEKMVISKQPGVVLLDIDICDLDPSATSRDKHIATCKNVIKAILGNTAVIVLTMRDDQSTFKEAIRCGARCYALKEIYSDELLGAIRAVAHGESFPNQVLTSHWSNLAA